METSKILKFMILNDNILYFCYSNEMLHDQLHKQKQVMNNEIVSLYNGN